MLHLVNEFKVPCDIPGCLAAHKPNNRVTAVTNPKVVVVGFPEVGILAAILPDARDIRITPDIGRMFNERPRFAIDSPLLASSRRGWLLRG